MWQRLYLYHRRTGMNLKYWINNAISNEVIRFWVV